MRFLVPPLAAAVIALALFWFMQYLIDPAAPPAQTDHERHVVQLVSPAQRQPASADRAQAAANPPPPPPAEPSMPHVNGLRTPAVTAPSRALQANLPDVSTSMHLTHTQSLGSHFGGFAGGAAGGGAGGGSGAGYGSGQDFSDKGKALVPLGTTRPQIPQYACKHHINGWVKVVFTVDAQGRPRNIRVINAHPRGLFEAAAVKYIAGWRYQSPGRPIRNVTQKIEMKYKDCQYNWQD